jgi:integrase/recombinase XerD
MTETFKAVLQQHNKADNTITAYLYAVNDYRTKYKVINKNNLLLYKMELIEKYKPKTVNLRILALNKYLEFIGKEHLRLKSVKVQQRSYLENVISQADYIFLNISVPLKSGSVKY